MHATGHFDVTVTPQTPDNPQARASGLGRLSLDKQFHGDLDAASQGEMLAAGDGTTSGAYVALEKVNGKLHGRSGTFVLVHRALMVDGTGMCGGCRVTVAGESRFACVDGPFFPAVGVDFDEVADRKSMYAEDERSACLLAGA